MERLNSRKKILIITFLLLIFSVIGIIAGDLNAEKCFGITSVYALDKKVKKISDIKSVTLIIRAVLLGEDFEKRIGMEPVPVTARGVIIFKDKNGKPCAIDYDGTAELSCPIFTKRFKIKPSDFTKLHWGLSDDYGYSIEFKVARVPYSQKPIFKRPYYTVKFKLENLEATCEFRPRTKEEEQAGGKGTWWLKFPGGSKKIGR